MAPSWPGGVEGTTPASELLRSAYRSADEPTGTDLFDRVLSSRTIRLAVLVCWWWLCWHFLAGQTVDG